MKRRVLLIGGLSALVLSVVGMAVSPGSGGDRFSYPHGSMMGWWNTDDHDELVPPLIKGARQVSVQAGEFVFDPSRIEIREGRRANIRLSNRGALFHDFTVEGLDFHLSAAPGKWSSGGLEAAEPGSYRFACTVPGHAEAGMVGTLVVR